MQLPKAALWYKYVSLVLPYFFPTSESEANSERFADASPSRKESVARAQNLLTSHTSLELRLMDYSCLRCGRLFSNDKFVHPFRFSEARCQRALPMAFAAYKEGLQPHYLEGYHNAKV